ncbi:MAG: hypothetical protein NTW95_06885 [Candidatus Aminicenantes bacterium]|nr:hypothetical protein [Candidatus Aminicenantes bacterium]
MFKIIYEFFISIPPIIISTAAFCISVFVLYQNFLKPFCLYVLTGHYLIEVKNNFLYVDLSIVFFNRGMRIGVIENIFLDINYGNEIIRLNQRHIRKFKDSPELVIERFWSPFFLNGKAEINQTVSFYSNRKIENQIEGKTLGMLTVQYKKNPKKDKLVFLRKKIDFNLISKDKFQLNKNLLELSVNEKTT